MNNENKKEPLHAGALAIEEALQKYVPETDPLVVKKIERWQELKFGLLMHWAPSSQWGIVESWSLCSEDEPWCKRSIENYDEYKRRYESLKKTFNPVRFNPERWAKAAEEAGMKYVVFTTKHHDGFCMFDTRTTDYRITAPDSPFHSHPRANITKGIFETFRAKGFLIGAYFSKPDWHSNDFWWERFATPDRNANYDIKKYPERWQRFVEFTHKQIDELMTDYGRIDILWLDGCWVRAYSEEELERERLKARFNQYRIQNQDIDMPLLTSNARKRQPGLIVVDRAVPGPFQNYLTPENQVPEKLLPYPWETCMPITPSWSYEPGLAYKPARTLIHLLVDVVAKGGNFLLNIAPTAEGDYEDTAYDRLREIGEWMKTNGEAIYRSMPIAPHKENNVCFTQSPEGTIYAIYLAEENAHVLPGELRFENFSPPANARIELLGTQAQIPWRAHNNGCVIEIPPSVRAQAKSSYAWTLRIRE
ncbi:MAG: alpha-L-fucosidase [Bacteroidota bacterium]|nr:alpha-L-fucosidase [Bacteroidota bacterium]